MPWWTGDPHDGGQLLHDRGGLAAGAVCRPGQIGRLWEAAPGWWFRQPRPAQLAQPSDGWQARANAAQANGFEALPLFFAGVLAAQQMHLDQGRIDLLALVFIALRVIFIGLYLADQATLRSLVWALGVATSIALFFA